MCASGGTPQPAEVHISCRRLPLGPDLHRSAHTNGLIWFGARNSGYQGVLHWAGPGLLALAGNVCLILCSVEYLDWMQLKKAEEGAVPGQGLQLSRPVVILRLTPSLCSGLYLILTTARCSLSLSLICSCGLVGFYTGLSFYSKIQLDPYLMCL